MPDYLELIGSLPLFRGVERGQLGALLGCLGSREQRCEKGQAVLQAGEPAKLLGAVLTGRVQVCRESADGMRVVLASIGPGGLFGEAHACAETDSLPVSVWAEERCTVLLLSCAKIITVCSSACPFHTRLIANLLRVLAEKNIYLTGQMEHLSKRTIREKLLSYLSAQAAEAGSSSFSIPFDRQALADYLCVDRSALSRELGLLQREGVLVTERSRFELLRQDT